jgi:hypothetical protein
MKALVKTLAIAGLFAMSSSAFAGKVEGKVETNANLGKIDQSATGSATSGSVSSGFLGIGAGGKTESKASENVLEVGVVKGTVGKSGKVETNATTKSISQTAKSGGKNTIKIGNVE